MFNGLQPSSVFVSVVLDLVEVKLIMTSDLTSGLAMQSLVKAKKVSAV